ncbi:MAG TPA: hypothetical protein VGH20_16940 [Myxococcales bacterium]|jgi:hypothetical protein
MTDELRIPKRRAQVELVLSGGARLHVGFFLAEFAGSHAGHERLSDLLNGRDNFLPAFDAGSETMTFVARGSIAAATVGQEWEPATDVGEAERHEVEIGLLGGTVLRGALHFLLPPDRSRLLDHLNDAQPFLRLEQGDKVVLVNKRQIARVSKVK